MGLQGAVRGALQHYRGGHGFESRWSPEALIAITTTIFKSNYDLKYRTSHHFNYKFNCVFVELCLNVFAGAITATETNVISTVLMLNSL